MKEFDYIIIGGGCAGLSLAYELEIHKKLANKTLAIIEPRTETGTKAWPGTQVVRYTVPSVSHSKLHRTGDWQ